MIQTSPQPSSDVLKQAGKTGSVRHFLSRLPVLLKRRDGRALGTLYELDFTEASMKTLTMAVAAVCASMAPAVAADISGPPLYKAAVPAPWSWTGFYLGANVGGHQGTDSITSTTDPSGWTPVGAASIDGSSPTSLHPRGVIAGLQAGYNLQINSIVLGLEGDMTWPFGTTMRTLTLNGLPAANGLPGFENGDFMQNSTKLQFLATVRPRLGVTFDHLLLYVTGGLAVGTLQTTDSFAAINGSSLATVSSSSSRTGWTGGGGAEYALTRNWSIKGEYLRVDLGTDTALIPTCPACVPGTDIIIKHKYTDDIVRFGANFKFDE